MECLTQCYVDLFIHVASIQLQFHEWFDFETNNKFMFMYTRMVMLRYVYAMLCWVVREICIWHIHTYNIYACNKKREWYWMERELCGKAYQLNWIYGDICIFPLTLTSSFFYKKHLENSFLKIKLLIIFLSFLLLNKHYNYYFYHFISCKRYSTQSLSLSPTLGRDRGCMQYQSKYLVLWFSRFMMCTRISVCLRSLKFNYKVVTIFSSFIS